MTVVAVASGRSAPGGTSLAVGLAMAWSRWSLNPLLVEADPAGGVLGLRFGLSSRPSLLSLATDARRSFTVDQLDAHTQTIGGAPALIGVSDPLVATRTVARAADIIGPELPRLRRPVVIDIGRADAASSALPFVDEADRVLIVTGPTTAEVQAMLFQLRLLRDRGAEPEVVVVGSGQNRPDEIAAFSGAPLAGVLPHNQRVASVFVGGRYRRAQLKRALLWRSVSALAAACVQNMATDPTLVALPVASDISQATETVSEAPTDDVVASSSPAPPPPPPPRRDARLSPPPLISPLASDQEAVSA